MRIAPALRCSRTCARARGGRARCVSRARRPSLTISQRTFSEWSRPTSSRTRSRAAASTQHGATKAQMSLTCCLLEFSHLCSDQAAQLCKGRKQLAREDVCVRQRTTREVRAMLCSPHVVSVTGAWVSCVCAACTRSEPGITLDCVVIVHMRKNHGMAIQM